MGLLRAHVVLAGVLIFMTSGVDAALPVLLRLAQPPPCPHCSMRGCHCGAGCCDTKGCRRPLQAADHASMGHHDGGDERGTESSDRREVAINPRCSGADDDVLPPAGGGRPALIARSASPVPPGGAGCHFVLPGIRPPTVSHEPPTPPPRMLG